MKLGAFVTTLNRPAALQVTLQALLDQTRPPDHLLVVDNGASTETAQVVARFPRKLVSYHPMPENVGPAGAAAYALERLSLQGFDWIYCGDDDDPPLTSDTLERLSKLAESADERTGAVGAVGARWDWKSGELQRLSDDMIDDVTHVDMIGGGQNFIVRAKVVARVGLPEAGFFFGLDDLEYCLRIRSAGYRLLVDGELMRTYREKKGRLNWTRPRSSHPRHPYDAIWRQYYSTRNYIFTMTRTFEHPELARREFWKSLARSCTSWARGPRYGFSFTRLQLRGVVDGYRGCMGRTVNPTPKPRGSRRRT
jgi:GT2 family glycosyltransferase